MSRLATRAQLLHRAKSNPQPAGTRSTTTDVQVVCLGVGLVLGIAWVGGSGQPPWIHLVRVLITVLSIGPIFALARQRIFDRPQVRTWPWLIPIVIAVKVLHVVLAIAVADLLGMVLDRAHETRHWLTTFSVFRVLVLLLIVLALSRWRRRGSRNEALPQALPGRAGWCRVIAAKLLALLAAMGLQMLLAGHLAHSDLLVAAFLTATVAGLGPRVLPYLISGRVIRPTPSPAADAGEGR